MDLVVLNHHAELFAHQVGDALHHLLLDLLGGDVLLRGGDVGFEQRFFTDDFDGLAQSQDRGLEAEIDLRGFALLHMNAGAHLHGVADEGRLEIIVAGRQVADLIHTVDIGHRAFIGPRDRDVDAGQRLLGALVGDPASDERRLGPGCGHTPQADQAQDE